MRCADKITLINNSAEIYNPETGEYEGNVSNSRDYFGMITNTPTELQLKYFGHFTSDTKVARIINFDGYLFNQCEIEGKIYNVKSRTLMANNFLTLILEESKNG